MTTNKPEVAGFISEVGIKKLREDEYTGDWTLYAGPVRNSVTPLIRLSDYEALQAECEELRTALAESRANDLTAMGYLNQIRGLVGAADLPDMVRRCEKLRAECERLRAAMIEAKSYIDHYMYGGSIYREPAAEAIAIIDAAMQGSKP